MSKKILLIDGMALLSRHFFATSLHKQFMRNSSGTPTNGVQGFVRHVFTAINETQPTHVAVCWDMGKSTFRNDMFDGCKQNRPAPPDELIPQFDYVKEVSNQFGFVNIGVQNFEADDVIGTLAEAYSEQNQIYIVTGDRDILQCINPNVEIWLTKKGFNIYNRYTLNRFQTEYGLNPSQLVDVKAFMGDTADGYSGVKGIGEKTAIKLIQNHGSVESVIAALDQLTPGQRNKIEADMDNLKLSKNLAKIHTEVPLNTSDLLDDMAFGTEITKVLNICKEHELYVSGKYLATHFS